MISLSIKDLYKNIYVKRGWVEYLLSSNSMGISVHITSFGSGILELSFVGVTGDGRSDVSLVSESEKPGQVKCDTITIGAVNSLNPLFTQRLIDHPIYTHRSLYHLIICCKF